MRLIFLNSPLLWGLAAIAAPLLIHLFLQRRNRLVRFSTLRFLKLTRRRPVRKRIDNWLLLALRTLLFALLALAFARPSLHSNPLGREQPKVSVFVLDRSMSLQTVENGTSRWETLRTKVLETLAKQGESTPIALISCASTTEVLLPLGPADRAVEAMKSLTPTFEECDLGAGLQEALRLVARRPEGTHASVYLVSDLQRASTENVHLVAVPDDVHVEVLSTGAAFLPQTALRDVRLTAEGKVEAVATNYSDAPVSSAKVTFYADDKPVDSKPVTLPAFGSLSLQFSPPNLAIGFHRLRCELSAEDPLAPDNTRNLAVYGSEPVPVLLVESRLSEPLARQPSYFAASALDPAAATISLTRTRYAVERVAPDALPGRLADSSKKTPRLVVLPSLQPLAPDLGRVLSAYVQKGGGLLLFLGQNLVGQEYNAAFQGVLPGLIGIAEEPADRPSKSWSLGVLDREDLFAIFRSARNGDLTIPRFIGRFGVTALSDSRVAASFDDGTPAILTRPAGTGRVGLINSTIDASWSDWPKRRTFVPMLHSLAGYLVDAQAIRSRCTAETLGVTASGTLHLGAWAAGETFVLQRPDGVTQQLKADAEGALRELDIHEPGFYSLKNAADAPVRLISAVTPAAEQDLTAFAAADFLSRQIQKVPAPERGAFDFARLQNELWKILLLVGLVLATLELYTANRSQS